MTAVVLRGDARQLPLPDESVDLIVTSPPYWNLRSYTDDGEHYDGQIGSEPTPAEWVGVMLDCTREWMRVLKPAGSMFVNLGDKYSTGNSGESRLDEWSARYAAGGAHADVKAKRSSQRVAGMAPKSLLGLPWRYANSVVDELSLILRAEIVWAKANPLPDSAGDRVRRSHEQVFHLVKQPRYFAAVDEIREAHTGNAHARGSRARVQEWTSGNGAGHRTAHGNPEDFNPLGKIPGSVWVIASQPLNAPAALGIDHFAAFPMELPRRIIQGWSPPGICVACGEGRRPVATASRDVFYGNGRHRSGAQQVKEGAAVTGWAHDEKWRTTTTITGYACACTPFTDHPERRQPTITGGRAKRVDSETLDELGLPRRHGDNWPARQPVREYHFDDWTPAPTRPAIVVDPFGGTGTTALVASALGRVGISVDRSHDYTRLAQWRTTDPAQRAAAMQVDKPPVQVDGQLSFEEMAG